jgi:16S rRNA (guanine966-N2)-methyltransferase
MRQVIFNMLQKYGLPDDGAVMDVFCGTGALGLEAISRGAGFCTFIDQSRASLDFCRKNVAALKVTERAALLNRDAGQPGVRDMKTPAATLAFLDPPYRKNLVLPALTALHDGGWLASGSICVVETEEEATGAAPERFTLLDSRAHGATKISFYRYEG